MKVFLDSSILCADFRLAGNNFQVFLGHLDRVPCDLCIPEIVIDETVNKFRQTVSSLLSQQRKVDISLQRHLGIKLGKEEVEGLDLEKVVNEYSSHLRSTLRNAGASFLPYPDVSHKTVVQKILKGEKPFRGGEKGYRDFLIYENFVGTSQVVGEQQKMILISHNSKDFGEEPKFHPEIESDLQKRYSWHATLFNSLASFNRQHILPRLDEVKSLREILEQHEGEVPDLHKWVSQHLNVLIEDDMLASMCVGFPENVGGASLVGVDKIESLVVEDTRLLSSGKKLVSLNAELRVVIDVTADESDSSCLEAREIFGHLDGYASTFLNTKVEVGFTVFLSEDLTHITSVELDSCSGERGGISFGANPQRFDERDTLFAK